jgi:hypothetical protein
VVDQPRVALKVLALLKGQIAKGDKCDHGSPSTRPDPRSVRYARQSDPCWKRRKRPAYHADSAIVVVLEALPDQPRIHLFFATDVRVAKHDPFVTLEVERTQGHLPQFSDVRLDTLSILHRHGPDKARPETDHEIEEPPALHSVLGDVKDLHLLPDVDDIRVGQMGQEYPSFVTAAVDDRAEPTLVRQMPDVRTVSRRRYGPVSARRSVSAR